jgi:hypothetical protein
MPNRSALGTKGFEDLKILGFEVLTFRPSTFFTSSKSGVRPFKGLKIAVVKNVRKETWYGLR